MQGNPCQSLAASARAAWPTVSVSSEAFAARLEQLTRAGQALPEAAHAADAYLAFACAEGDAAAISAFDSDYLSRVPSMVSRIDSSPVLADEVQQILRERLLVSSGAPAKIAAYGGRGSLLGWLKVAAVRCALELHRARQREASGPLESTDIAADALIASDPELEYLHGKYTTEFKEAFAEALLGLDAKQRTVLQLYLADGLNIDKIAKLYAVHRATVARWIADTREVLYQRTSDLLRLRLNITETEFQSIVRLVQSQLDVSVRRLLSEAAQRELLPPGRDASA